jgi:hypothetical protein
VAALLARVLLVAVLAYGAILRRRAWWSVAQVAPVAITARARGRELVRRQLARSMRGAFWFLGSTCDTFVRVVLAALQKLRRAAVPTYVVAVSWRVVVVTGYIVATAVFYAAVRADGAVRRRGAPRKSTT